MSDHYRIIFHNEISTESFVKRFKKIGWPTNLQFPTEGFLPKTEFKMFVNIARANTSQKVYVYQKVPNTIWRNNASENLTLCSLDESLEYFPEDFVGYLYDEQRTWLIFTDTDLAFSIVGCTKKMMTDLTRSELETLECTIDTRVDNLSDKIN